MNQAETWHPQMMAITQSAEGSELAYGFALEASPIASRTQKLPQLSHSGCGRMTVISRRA
jgi:hypothetical protein